jgi:dihydrofolate reductase
MEDSSALTQEIMVPRKVVAYELLSLDGVAEQPDDFVTDFDDVMRENLRRVISTQDTVLLGRKTFDDWARFWPTSHIEPFASFINGVEKFVATSRPLGQKWTNVSVVKDPLAELVFQLKAKAGGDIGLHGSIALTQSLLQAGVVDELRLVIAPAIQGQGRKLFQEGLPRRLTLTRTVTSPSGYLLLDFRS